ncbi:hypothetical protein Mal64_03410 [Pseudobythopirellula maris]|uniref:Aerotolerance regulator N-terminal domain-containing protein n=2 Tax=Pseudobythopirellula maris TaxID=2527991 RepID=A0A5C5ZR42_9BACT|nr:hypothetical protein Mal64_03410 [Pseudobythopirellula maris]
MLAWLGVAAAAAPVLLHLINLRRRKRIPWAAMAFLLESDQQHRSSVQLKELLLMAMRVAIILLAACLLGGLQAEEGLSDWFQRAAPRTLVLVDDSFSMADHSTDADVWRTAVAVAERIASPPTAATGEVTTVRFSELIHAADDEMFAAAPLGGEEARRRVRLLEERGPSQTAVGPAEALRRLAAISNRDREASYTNLYVVSDFRKKDLTTADELAELVDEAAAGAEPRFVHCAPDRRGNLSLSELRLLPGARAAGVEATLRLSVTNHSAIDAEGVVVRLTRDGAALPAVALDTIGAGETVTRQAPLRFATPGRHTLVARLDADAVPADNRRFLAVDLPESHEVLLVDGSSGGAEGRVFAAALRPQGSLRTGWRPEPRANDDPSAFDGLEQAAAVMLLDPTRLDSNAAAKLRAYLADGGGVLICLGPNADRGALGRRIFADAKTPLLPIGLDLPTQVAPPPDGAAPLALREHPLFKAFQGERNGFLPLIRMAMRWDLRPAEAPPEGSAPAERGYRVLAQTADGAPLILERTSGPGRLLVMLTTTARPPNDAAAPAWSNLATLPVFPILVNEIAGWLAVGRTRESDLTVGTRLAEGAVAARQANAGGPPDQSPAASLDPPSPAADSAAHSTPLLSSGIYSIEYPAQPTAATASGHARSVAQPRWTAVNVEPSEGDLTSTTTAEVASLAGGRASVVTADAFLDWPKDTRNASLGPWLGLLLLAALAGERALSNACSYVQARPAKASAVRGRV